MGERAPRQTSLLLPRAVRSHPEETSGIPCIIVAVIPLRLLQAISFSQREVFRKHPAMEYKTGPFSWIIFLQVIVPAGRCPQESNWTR
ncbi:MAG: hypothetical protein FD153_1697 [Rhodospirillaceae bacterium]|nr:MAG: hypothetical protein FD153_1697 [Rhodospirillaceae bacterium]